MLLEYLSFMCNLKQFYHSLRSEIELLKFLKAQF